MESSQTTQAKRSRWRAVVVTLAAGMLAVLVAILLAGVWFVTSHRQATRMSAEAAAEELDRVRSAFGDRPALVDMSTRQAPDSALAPGGDRPALRTFHTVIFDTRGDDRMVRIAVPYWLARRYARHDNQFAWLGELTFLDDTEFDSQPIRLSLAELERHGPGLVVDYRLPTGGQFLSWVE